MPEIHYGGVFPACVPPVSIEAKRVTFAPELSALVPVIEDGRTGRTIEERAAVDQDGMRVSSRMSDGSYDLQDGDNGEA